ncbi:MAG: hypothetical protein IPN76_29185 [Saprospiraceae bacterium]|jgi:hypothetical protein|nr:hypothetical protein [Saprospiraceae bacterium]
MKNLAYLFLAYTIMLAFSCKDKDDDATTAPISATEYFPLSPGNYWIYNWVKIDTMGNETPYIRIDTVTVTGEEVVNGFTYAKVKGTNFGGEFEHLYRDSSGFLVKADGGTPVFSVNQGILLGQDTTWSGDFPLFWTEEKMKTGFSPVTVPAGTFEECLSKDLLIYPLGLESPFGVRTYPYYYAKGVGLVQHYISFYSTPDYYESRLVEYHIE